MAQTAQQLSPAPESGKPRDTTATLREELKAHLQWCAYLGASVGEESLADLAVMLRRTARTMRTFAEQAEQQAE